MCPEALSTGDELLNSRLLDTAPDAMVVVGSDGIIKLVNLQTEKMFGYARQELVDSPLDLLIPERSWAFEGHGALLREPRGPSDGRRHSFVRSLQERR